MPKLFCPENVLLFISTNTQVYSRLDFNMGAVREQSDLGPYCYKHICLFDLLLYVPSTIFQLNMDGSSWVEPVLS